MILYIEIHLSRKDDIYFEHDVSGVVSHGFLGIFTIE